jgi:hypothetical protein
MHTKETQFTEIEISYIRERYEIDGPKVVGIYLSRSMKSISKKALSLGLIRSVGRANTDRVENLPKKQCSKCRREFPATAKYFYFHRSFSPIPNGASVWDIQESGFLISYCKECHKQERKERYLLNKESTKQKNKEWKISNKEYLRTTHKQWLQTPIGKFSSYSRNAKSRGLSFVLTFEEFVSFWQQPCWYCGGEISTIGLDRINNQIGYTKENCTPCCIFCNRMKMDHTQKEFFQQITNIFNQHKDVCWNQK